MRHGKLFIQILITDYFTQLIYLIHFEAADLTVDCCCRCGHCKMLKPVYSEVAKHFKDVSYLLLLLFLNEFLTHSLTHKQDEGVTIAAMDATAHTVPSGFDVQGYPTLYYVPSSTKKPVPYDGDREKDAIIDFINSNRS